MIDEFLYAGTDTSINQVVYQPLCIGVPRQSVFYICMVNNLSAR